MWQDIQVKNLLLAKEMQKQNDSLPSQPLYYLDQRYRADVKQDGLTHVRHQIDRDLKHPYKH